MIKKLSSKEGNKTARQMINMKRKQWSARTGLKWLRFMASNGKDGWKTIEKRFDELAVKNLSQMIVARVSMDRVGSDHIILLFFLILFKSDLIKFGSKIFDPYSTRPDRYKIIKYLLIIFYIILSNKILIDL
jgi:Respiratory burst NADPH oxidase